MKRLIRDSTKILLKSNKDRFFYANISFRNQALGFVSPSECGYIIVHKERFDYNLYESRDFDIELKIYERVEKIYNEIILNYETDNSA